MKKLTKNAIIFASGALVGAILYKSHMMNELEKFKEETETGIRACKPEFTSRLDAEEALRDLNDLIFDYGLVTESDFYKICGVKDHNLFTCHKYGWVDIKDAKIVKLGKDNYTIIMPKLLPIE